MIRLHTMTSGEYLPILWLSYHTQIFILLQVITVTQMFILSDKFEANNVYFVEIDCGNLPDLLNGSVSISEDTVHATYNSTIEYRCDNGFIFSNNENKTTITCGITGFWSELLTICDSMYRYIVIFICKYHALIINIIQQSHFFRLCVFTAEVKWV